MVSSNRAYQRLVFVLSAVFLLLGLALITRTLASGGGPLSLGMLLGLAFIAVGAGRLWIASRTSP